MIFRVGVSLAWTLLGFGLLTVWVRLVGDAHASSHARARPRLRQSSRLVISRLVLKGVSHGLPQVTQRSLAPHAVHAWSQTVVRGKSPYRPH